MAVGDSKAIELSCHRWVVNAFVASVALVDLLQIDVLLNV